MSDAEIPESSRNVSRRLRWFLGGLIVIIGIMGGVAGYLWLRKDAALVEAIREADRLDPGWRLEELEAKRESLSAENNGATIVLAAYAKLPKKWPSRENVAKSANDWVALQRQPVAVLYGESLHKYLQTAVAEAEDALPEARKLADHTQGRFPIVFKPDFGSSNWYLEEKRSVQRLLCYHATLKAQQNDMKEALISCRAAANSSRVIGDEPSLLSMLIRISVRGLSLQALERVLAQGEPLEEELGLIQKALERDAADNLLLIGIRGERAGMNRLFESIESGIVPAPNMNDMVLVLDPEDKPSMSEQINWYLPGTRRQYRAEYLKYQTQCVEIAKRPWHEQETAMDEVQTNLKGSTFLRLFSSTWPKFVSATLRSQAEMHAAIVALAVERYRLKHERWPRMLADLCPEYLAAIPVDPYNGETLHYRRWAEGVVIYSVGPDKTDNGGNIQRQKSPNEPGTDIGFQLWDPDKRRQPAKD
jgi:hypothetical protein